MSTPQERIEADVKAAMKSGDKEKLATLRMLLAEIKNDRIAAGKEVDEARFAALVRKAIKQRHEAASQFRAGGRDESAAKEEREAGQLEAYLPQAVPEEVLRAAVRELVERDELSGPAAIGKIMKELLPRFGTAVDGATLNRIAREELTSS